MDATLLGKAFLAIFFLYTQQIKLKLVLIDIEFNSISAFTPLPSFAKTPFNNVENLYSYLIYKNKDNLNINYSIRILSKTVTVVIYTILFHFS